MIGHGHGCLSLIIQSSDVPSRENIFLVKIFPNRGFPSLVVAFVTFPNFWKYLRSSDIVF
eukprot:09044.XXX_409966_410145_1 [CDS] Oithona nana genome sequencing.